MRLVHVVWISGLLGNGETNYLFTFVLIAFGGGFWVEIEIHLGHLERAGRVEMWDGWE